VRTVLATLPYVTGVCTWINTFALACLVTCASACQERSQPQPNAALQSFVEGKALDAAVAGGQIRAAERTRLTDQVRRVYKDQNYGLIWIEGDRLSDRYRQFAKTLAAADERPIRT